MNTINVLNLVLIILILVIFCLAGVYVILVFKSKNKAKDKKEDKPEDKKKLGLSGRFREDLTEESIYKFMEFDEVKDNMIIRKNREQYIMVIQCQGVNYDLMSEEEKIAVEEGFVQFLNTLRFPIQLYIQTRSLNLRDIVDEYKTRIKAMEQEIEQLETKAREAEMKGNLPQAQKLRYQKRRKENVLSYGADISEYVGRLSLNKNVLQQKTYVIVSYFVSEFGSTSTYSNDEIDNMCFSELYTRAQSIIRSLSSSEVSGKILDSEEIAELLYVAYNRDDSEIMQLTKALDAQYDALYSTSKDVLLKKQEKLDEQMEVEAIEIATDSIIEADKIIKEEAEEKARKQEIEKRALNLVEQYKGQMDKGLYEETKRQIKRKATGKEEPRAKEEIKEEPKKETTKNKETVKEEKPKKTRTSKKAASVDKETKAVQSETAPKRKTTKKAVESETTPAPAKRGRRKLNTEKIAK